MQALFTLLSQPLAQIAAIAGVVVGLQKYGIDVVGVIKTLFTDKKNLAQTTPDFDNRTALQSLMTQMETLSGHYNHDTTALLTEIRDSLTTLGTQLTANFTAIHSKHDEWDRRGIPTEDCKSNKK